VTERRPIIGQIGVNQTIDRRAGSSIGRDATQLDYLADHYRCCRQRGHLHCRGQTLALRTRLEAALKLIESLIRDTYRYWDSSVDEGLDVGQ